MTWGNPTCCPQGNPHRNHQGHQEVASDIEKREETWADLLQVEDAMGVFKGNFSKHLPVKNNPPEK